MQDIFEVVKKEVTPLEALKRYGLHPIRKGGRYWLLCPFHNERHPSMLVDEKLHCFGCGWHGDVVDFVAEYFYLQPLEAAQKLAEDFGISIKTRTHRKKKKATTQAQEKHIHEERLCQAYLGIIDKTFNFLSDLYHLYGQLKAKIPEDLEQDVIAEAYHNHTLVGYWLDLLLEGTPQEKLYVVKEVAKWIPEQRF